MEKDREQTIQLELIDLIKKSRQQDLCERWQKSRSSHIHCDCVSGCVDDMSFGGGGGPHDREEEQRRRQQAAHAAAAAEARRQGKNNKVRSLVENALNTLKIDYVIFEY